MAWIDTIEPHAAQGPLKTIYAAAVQRAGRVSGIVKLMSLEPTTLQASMGLYLATTRSPHSPLPRWFRELIAVRVSQLNRCVY